jgi:predicted DNA-binding transcriptional regulator AlpA
VRELIQNLEQIIAQTAPSACPQLVGELERLKTLAWVKAIWPPASQLGHQSASIADRYLTVPEVVVRFNVTAKWLYRHKRQMPHSQPSRKVLIFPEQAITKWFASRKGA